MGILEKISEIEKEIARTQKNKGAEGGRGLRETGTAGGQVGWAFWGARVVCELRGAERGEGAGDVGSLGVREAASYGGWERAWGLWGLGAGGSGRGSGERGAGQGNGAGL